MELTRLRAGELIAAAGGVALLVVMFLDWYAAGGTTEVAGRDIEISVGFNAWQAFGDHRHPARADRRSRGIGLAVVTASRRSPALPVAASVITATVGAFATLLVFYRILNQPGPNEFIEVQIRAFLGFLCVLAIAAGGWLSMRDEQWPDAPVATDVRPAPPAEGPRDPRRRPRPSLGPDPPRLHGRMLSRDQVLHVARLARLELSEEELETMAGELSGVLDHIEKIGELGDLEDVPPTSHVVAVENALRADEPRPSLPREVALASAPDPAPDGFRVPSPGAAPA